ncbi:MAG: flagellar motor switch phosphatase FliY [Bacillota bacterium]
MNNQILSQDEIDALLASTIIRDKNGLTPSEIIALDAVYKLAFSDAAETLSSLLKKRVNLLPPAIRLVDQKALKSKVVTPSIAAEIRYHQDAVGRSLLFIPARDARAIASLMLGKEVETSRLELDELELSAAEEAIFQLVNSCAKTISKVLGQSVKTKKPIVNILRSEEETFSSLAPEEKMVDISFRGGIGEIIETEFKLLIPMPFARGLAEAQNNKGKDTVADKGAEEPKEQAKGNGQAEQIAPGPEFMIQPIQYPPATPDSESQEKGGKGVILDLDLELTARLGSTHMKIKELLELGSGSVVTLNKFAREPVDILANGKLIAKGQITSVGENVGVKITEIVSPMERVNNRQ